MMILEPTMANPIPGLIWLKNFQFNIFVCLCFCFILIKIEIQLADSPVADSFDCPLTSLCRKHCQENGFKDGVCQGLLNKDCRCIGWFFSFWDKN